MRASDDSTIPPRSGLGRLIRPWEYRHARAVANVRFAAGGFQFGIGLVLLSLGRQAGTVQERRKCLRWSAFFLVFAALNFLEGFLDTIVAPDRRGRQGRRVSRLRGTGLTCTGVSPRATRYAYRPDTDDRRRAIVRADSPDSRSAGRTTVRSPR